MTRTVYITPKAQEEILSISKWWAEHRSVEQSLRWYDGILKRIHSLAGMPQSHPLIYENINTSFEFREAYFGLSGSITHRIVYRVLPKMLEVLAVRHVSQDNLSEKDLQ